MKLNSIFYVQERTKVAKDFESFLADWMELGTTKILSAASNSNCAVRTASRRPTQEDKYSWSTGDRAYH